MLQFDTRITVRENVFDQDESIEDFPSTDIEEKEILTQIEKFIEEQLVVILTNYRSFECRISWINKVK